MSKLNKSKGNMFPWVTHTWSPLIGCGHQCLYCYVKSYKDLPVIPYLNGPFPDLGGTGKTIFVGHECDLFGENVPSDLIEKVLDHCNHSGLGNNYVLQTKNPYRIFQFKYKYSGLYMLGITIETNRQEYLSSISKAPGVRERALGLANWPYNKFITVEPILDFDVKEMIDLIKIAGPDFINIGADSKGHYLVEPSREKINDLVAGINDLGIEIREKRNLGRLLR